MATQSRPDRVDEAVDDSFPASDPPSFTPITGTGSREQSVGTSGHDGDEKSLGQPDHRVATWVGIAGASAALLAVVVRRRRRARPSRIARVTAPLREFARRAAPS